MHPMLILILKRGLFTAAILAICGYFMAEFASMWVSSQSAAAGADYARSLRLRMPLAMAGCGFALVIVFETLLTLIRGKKLPLPVRHAPSVSTEDEVEQLLNQLLQQADAAEAARAAKGNSTPCPAASPTENSPVPH